MRNLARVLDRNLSFTERRLASRIAALVPDGGRVVASVAADAIGVSRGAGVTALKKLAVAGVIETRSLGVKGLWVKVLEPGVWRLLAKEGEADGPPRAR